MLAAFVCACVLVRVRACVRARTRACVRRAKKHLTTLTATQVYDGTAGTLTFYRNGTEIPGQHSGISGEVSPVVDLSLGASVDLIRQGSYSTGTVRLCSYARETNRGSTQAAVSLTTPEETEKRFSEVVALLVNREVIESTMEKHYDDIAHGNAVLYDDDHEFIVEE